MTNKYEVLVAGAEKQTLEKNKIEAHKLFQFRIEARSCFDQYTSVAGATMESHKLQTKNKCLCLTGLRSPGGQFEKKKFKIKN